MSYIFAAEQNLSPREKQVLTLLACGYNQLQVADKAYLSQHTVNFHVRNILQKLQAVNTTAAVALAVTYGLISIDVPNVLGNASKRRKYV